MALINWNSELSVGVQQLDDQHKKLINLINTLHDSMAQGKGSSIISDIIGKLAMYAKVHFGKEEELLLRYQYPNFEQHKKEHIKFIKEINTFYKNMETQKFKLPLEVMNFLKVWLITHIQTVDAEYSEYLNANNVY